MPEDNWGDLSVEGLYLSHKEYYDSIDQKFIKESKVNCYLYSRLDLYQFTNGTYFEWLPYELIEKIVKCERNLLESYEKSYFKRYFSSEDSDAVVERCIIPRNKELEYSNNPLLIQSNVDNGFGRTEIITQQKIYRNNSGGRCYNSMSDIIKKGCNSIDGLLNMSYQLKEWFIWICDHSYKACWNRLMKVVISKINEFDTSIYQIECGGTNMSKIPIDQIDRARKVINDLKYFIDYYVPYSILTRSKNYFSSQEDYKKTLYCIYDITEVHPNSIDLDEVYEYEMSIYAPDYYNNVYLNYKKLRNGKRVIPAGEKPMFYWWGDEYIFRFV